MSVNRLAPLVVPAAKLHTATVIFVHELGNTGHGWASAVENWRQQQRLDEVKFILPHAPRIPITFNGGIRIPGWFDIVALNCDVNALHLQEDIEGIKLSQKYFHELIQEEIDSGIPADRIVLGGSSQGGAMSLLSGLTFNAKLAGIMSLSAWFVLPQSFPDLISPTDTNRETPVIMFHGDHDTLLPTNRAKRDAERLTELGYDVTWKTYPGMGHSTCPEELDDVEAFLSARLPPNAGKDGL
ncbi:acyl-protein thioesterase 1 [Dactylonectria macrodidyma]|uniref:Acyl-protein thioesterase 1 n=1 Tax=Dactylonectria macrodidyma TaxID=307937 RepID=A0A9P9DTV4_9HYPO|nr:acyl-protein thioesterase 1 [Dactylonectria macrodidyma]